MPILITGVAGFIGCEVALKLLRQGIHVVGIDNLNNYYSQNLKKDRLNRCGIYKNFTFIKLDILSRDKLADLFSHYQFTEVIHLAAQAGVPYSIKNPHLYVDNNIVGFMNVLECSRHANIKHFVFASSSSVYGANVKLPFTESDDANHPISLYGATKRANELMAHSYAHLFKIPCTGLRFFTVYGPWCRPDMALYKFAHHILTAKPITVYNDGKITRDFTYIDDIVTGVTRIMGHIPHQTLAKKIDSSNQKKISAPYEIYNIGNHKAIDLNSYIYLLEKKLDKKATIKYLPLQRSDVPHTHADVTHIEQVIGKLPHTQIEVGIDHFVNWYKNYAC